MMKTASDPNNVISFTPCGIGLLRLVWSRMESTGFFEEVIGNTVTFGTGGRKEDLQDHI
jgi:hypothetical protein